MAALGELVDHARRHLLINAGTPRPPQPIGVPFLDARHRAAAADVPRVTVVQPTLYLENLSAPWWMMNDGVVASPLPGDVPVPWVATADVAIAVERAITRDVGGWFALPGVPAAGHEVASAIGTAIGRALRWQTITPEQLADRLRPHLGEHAAEGTAAVYRMHAETPPVWPDPAPAREALDWAPRDAAIRATGMRWPLALAA